MTWDIVVGIITLVTVGIAIGKLISNNTKTMTELKCSIDELTRSFSVQRENIHNAEKKIDDHEHRITVLESKTN